MIYGKTGQLSRCLVVNALKYGFRPIVIGRPEVPIDDFHAISCRIKEYKPDIFINASAYNDVEGAESDYESAHIVNTIGPMLMARAANKFGIPIIHISTDYVFSGDKNLPYKEDEEASPINKYGLSKLLGEAKVKEENDNHVIIRTSWVFSPFAKNFMKTILENAKNDNSPMHFVSDQYNIPTSGLSLAKNILQIAKKLINEPDNKEIKGLFHISSLGIASRADYATQIFLKAKEYNLPYCEVIPVESSFFPSEVKRPKYSALDSTKVTKTYNIELKNWRDEIDEVFELNYKKTSSFDKHLDI